MRIRMISSLSHYGAGLGGATAALAQALRDGGDAVLVQSDRTGSSNPPPTDQVREVWDRSFRYVRQNRRAAGQPPDYDLLHLQHEYTLYGPPVTALQFPRLVSSLRRFHRPEVVTLHHVVPLTEVAGAARAGYVRGPTPLLRWGLRTITRQVVHRSDAIVVHSAFAKDVLIRDYGAEAPRITVIPLGVEPEPAGPSPAEAKASLGLGTGRVLLNLGHLARYKGLETLIDAYNLLGPELHDLQLVVAGGPPVRLGEAGKQYAQELTRRVAPRLAQRAHFPGYVPESLVSTYFAAADLVVLPYASPISSSAVLTRALGFGLPVLASRLGPLEEALGRPEALFAPGSVSDLAARIRALLDDPSLLAALALQNRLRGTQDAWTQVAARHRALYHSLIRPDVPPLQPPA